VGTIAVAIILMSWAINVAIDTIQAAVGNQWMARKTELHVERARQAWPLLVDKAKSGGAPFTYREIGDAIDVHCRAAAWFLGVIQAHCLERNWPRLQALVVNKATRLPGAGYNGSRNQGTFERDLAAV